MNHPLRPGAVTVLQQKKIGQLVIGQATLSCSNQVEKVGQKQSVAYVRTFMHANAS